MRSDTDNGKPVRAVAFAWCVVVAASMLIVAPGAKANHIPGATYMGTHQGGGTVEFTISPDGNRVTAFKALGLQGTCGAECTCTTGVEATFPIADHAFDFQTSTGRISGAFPGTQSAQGHVSLSPVGDPPCVTAEVAWSATTTAPPPPPPPPPSDTTAPTVTITFAAQRLRVALSEGIKLRAATSEAGRVCGSLTLFPNAARRVGLQPTTTEQRRGTVVLGSRCATFRAAGTRTITVPFTRRAKRAFAKLVRARRTLTVRASIAATDAAGNQGSAARQLRLGR